MGDEPVGEEEFLKMMDQYLEFAVKTGNKPEGAVECNSVFRNDTAFGFDPELPFEVIHLSHCAQVNVIQNGQRITLLPVSEIAGYGEWKYNFPVLSQLYLQDWYFS